MSDITQQLGKRIRALRTRHSYTQEQLAEIAGISPKYLGEVERGEGNISVERLTAIANALHITLPDLVAVEHERSHEEIVVELECMVHKLSREDAQFAYRMLKALVQG